jgi:RNA polymerase sigma-70 factor, ECF subfamily
MSAPPSTAQTIRLARRGDRYAIEALFDAHWRTAWRVAYAVTHDGSAADDAAQEGLIKAFRALASFDDSRQFEPWLHRIVVNCAKDHLRRESRVHRRHPAHDIADGDDPPEFVALWTALGQLRTDRRTVVLLRYWFGYEPHEMAAILGVAPGTVHSRLHRAILQLRDILEVHSE